MPPGPACRVSSVLTEAGKPGELNLGLLFAALTELRLGNHPQARSTLALVLPALEFFVVAQILVGMLLPTGEPAVAALSCKVLWQLGGDPLERGSCQRLGRSSRARARHVSPGPAPCALLSLMAAEEHRSHTHSPALTGSLQKLLSSF